MANKGISPAWFDHYLRHILKPLDYHKSLQITMAWAAQADKESLNRAAK
jgi:hypothetical protein